MVMAQSSGDRQVAVLIDDENVGLGSVEWLFDQVSNLGRILIRRAYSDWSKGGKARDQLLEFGIEPVHVFQTSSSGKNASDIRLVIDAIDILHSSSVDTFVIVSGDADFLPLVNKLRSSGKMVIGAGRQKSTSATLVKACDRYYYLDKHEESGEESSKPLPKERPRGGLLARAVRASMDADGKVTGSRLHATMQRLDPGFDFRDRSFNSFTAFLEASSEVRVTRPAGPGKGDVVIELRRTGRDESAPKKPPAPAKPNPAQSVASKIDAEWSKRAPARGKSMPGAVAAREAAMVLGASKLSASEYKNLQRLLEAMPQLAKIWQRDGNTISRK